jgi:hypothetical protein
MDPTNTLNSIQPYLSIPESIRAFVYLVGMVGFPVVVTMFVLSRLGDRLKNVEKSLLELSDRITERPMGLERTTDFVIFLCDSLLAELKAGLPELVRRELSFTCTESSKESIARCLTVIRRETAGYLRPIFRKHQRFASRFPTVGGNLGSMFSLSAPGEDISAGQTEARLVGQTYKDPAEVTLALVINNISDFGHPTLEALKREREELPASIAAFLEHGNPSKQEATTQAEVPQLSSGSFDVIEPGEFTRLSLASFETVCTILRDSILEQVRSNTSEFEGTDRQQQ